VVRVHQKLGVHLLVVKLGTGVLVLNRFELLFDKLGCVLHTPSSTLLHDNDVWHRVFRHPKDLSRGLVLLVS
jgi:hypothetical protein